MYPWASGDALSSTRLKHTAANIHAFTAGEAINASSSPIAVYIDSADNGEPKIASSAADSTAIVHGFVAEGQNVANGAEVYVQTSGMVSGFTGLTAGADYYLSTAGAVSTTQGTVSHPIGIAISTTALWISPTPKIAEGQDSRNVSASTGQQTITHNLGTLPKLIKITAFKAAAGTAEHGMSVGTARGTVESCSWITAVDSSADVAGQTSGRIIDVKNGVSTTVHDAILESMTSTTFVLNWQTASGSGITYLQWEVYG